MTDQYDPIEFTWYVISGAVRCWRFFGVEMKKNRVGKVSTVSLVSLLWTLDGTDADSMHCVSLVYEAGSESGKQPLPKMLAETGRRWAEREV